MMHSGCHKEHIATLKASELDVTVDDARALFFLCRQPIRTLLQAVLPCCVNRGDTGISEYDFAIYDTKGRPINVQRPFVPFCAPVAKKKKTRSARNKTFSCFGAETKTISFLWPGIARALLLLGGCGVLRSNTGMQLG
jgi:hypothetical protein